MSLLPSLSSPSIEITGRVVEPCQFDPEGDAPIRADMFGQDDLEACDAGRASDRPRRGEADRS